MIEPYFGAWAYNPFYADAIDSVRKVFASINDLSMRSAGINSIINRLSTIEIDFSYSSGNVYNAATGVLTINPNDMDGRINDSFNPDGAGQYGSFARTIFHELVHAATVSDTTVFASDLNNKVNFSEAIAIFAENLLYVPAVPEERERAGHSTWEGPTSDTSGTMPKWGGFSGVTAFNWLQGPSDTGGPQLISTSGNGVTFGSSSSNGIYSVSKTYVTGGQFRVEVSGHNGDGFLLRNGVDVTRGAGIAAIADTLMGGKSYAITSMLNFAKSTLNNFASFVGDRFGQTDVVGLSGERFYTRELDGFTATSTTMYDFRGLGLQERDQYQNIIYSYSPPVITVSAAGATDGTIVMGASGADYSTLSADNLIGGSGNDILISSALQNGNVLDGGAGNDLLVGSAMAGDNINGGPGNDLIIARGLAASYSGGGGQDILSYYGFSEGITMTGGSVAHHGTTDIFNEIDILIGTTGADIFALDGDHPMILGGAGSDTFYGRPSAPIYGGRGIDTLDLRGGGAVTLNTGWLTIDSIEVIQGSEENDVFVGGTASIFRNVEPNVTPTIYGNGGDDHIEQWGSTNIRAGADNDTVVVFRESYGALDGGSGLDTLDFSQLAASNLTVVLAGESSTYKVDAGNLHTFTGFERVKFGSVALFLNGTGTFSGGTGNNKIYGSEGIEEISVNGTGGWVQARGGNDVIHSYGLESVYGEMGDDHLYAGDQVGAKLNGGVYPDQAVIWVNDGNDFLQGGALSDRLDGGTGRNEMHGGGGYDHFYSNGYGENVVYGDADGGDMRINLTSKHPNQSGAILASIHDMGGWFDVTSTTDHGQTFRHDSLYDIDKLYLLDATFDLRAGLHYDTGLFMI